MQVLSERLGVGLAPATIRLDDGTRVELDSADAARTVLEENLDFDLVRETCTRLFAYRAEHGWPPVVVVNDNWDTLYAASAAGVEVLLDVAAAAEWANGFIRRIDAAIPAEMT